MLPLTPLLILPALIAAAIVTDLRSRRIPNTLIMTGWALALAWQLFAVHGHWTFDPQQPGATGLSGWIIGAGALLAVFLPLYAMGAMGAGDVKLMSVIGAFFGASLDAWTQLAGVALFVLISGGLLALLRAAITGQSGRLFSNLKLILIGYRLRLADVPGPVFDAQTDTADRMPYAIAIATGTAAYLLSRWKGWVAW
jgi:prepilin peptidase CpaA